MMNSGKMGLASRFASDLSSVIKRAYPEVSDLTSRQDQCLAETIYQVNRMVQLAFEMFNRCKPAPHLPRTVMPHLLEQLQQSLVLLQASAEAPQLKRFLDRESSLLAGHLDQWPALERRWWPCGIDYSL